MSDVDIEEIRLLTKKGLNELLEQAHLEPDDLFVLGLSTSEVYIQALTKENSKNLAKKALVYLTQYVEMKESLFIDIPDKLQLCTYT